MWLLVALAMQAAPPPSGGRLPFGAVEIVNPIAPAVGKYSDCVRKQMENRGALPIIDRATYRVDVESSIAACAAVRASSVVEAEAALSKAPGYHNAQRRAQAIKHAFDGTDFQKRELLRIMDVVRREKKN